MQKPELQTSEGSFGMLMNAKIAVENLDATKKERKDSNVTF